MLYIIKSDYFMSTYILDALAKNEQIKMIYFERDKLSVLSKVKRFIRAFLIRRKGLWTHLFYHERIIREIGEIRPEDKVLFFAIDNLKELLILDKEVSAKEKSAFLWNPVASSCRNLYSKMEYFIFMNLLPIHIYTFDPQDAKCYHFRYLNQVYRFPETTNKVLKTKENISDIFYIGKDKKRNDELARLYSLFSDAGAVIDFYIYKDKRTKELQVLKGFYYNAPLAYSKVLDRIQQSICMLEILQKGQTGVTLRTLEALSLEKKLITNNKTIKLYDIYNPKNILVYTQDTTSTEIREFLAIPYEPVDKEVLSKYEINTWIKLFL